MEHDPVPCILRTAGGFAEHRMNMGRDHGVVTQRTTQSLGLLGNFGGVLKVWQNSPWKLKKRNRTRRILNH